MTIPEDGVTLPPRTNAPVRPRSPWRRWATVVVSVAAVAFIARSLLRDGPAALEAWRAASVQWGWIAVALACAFSGHAWYVLGWQRLLRDLGVRASFVALARLFLVSNLGRYIPGGKAWQMAIIAAMATDAGLPPARVAASSLGQGVVGMGVGVLVLVAAGGSALGVSPVWLAFSLSGVVALLLGPASIRALPQLAAGIERRVPGITTVTARTMWTLLWTATASWLLWGVALYALGRAVLSLAGLSLVTSVTAWTGSFLAGLLLVIAPAGLGAREGVMQAVLARAALPASDILVVVVLARVGVTLIDLIPALLVLAWRRRGTSRAAAHDHA